MSNWIDQWIIDGDDMPCPNCGEQSLETQDGITSCGSCGWETHNSASANTAQIYSSTSFSFECPNCGSIVDVDEPDEDEVECSECYRKFPATYIG